jgi:hypothetical protein
MLKRGGSENIRENAIVVINGVVELLMGLEYNSAL